jgi:hypothetical protein
MRLFVGDDWAGDHHDVELMDAAGRVLARKRLPEGVAGIAGLHGLIGQHLGEDPEGAEVIIGIETDRGPWVAALVAAGYVVYGVNPLQASRYHRCQPGNTTSGSAAMRAPHGRAAQNWLISTPCADRQRSLVLRQSRQKLFEPKTMCPLIAVRDREER